MPFLDLPNELPPQDDIVVELVPKTCGSRFGARELGKRVEENAICDKGSVVTKEGDTSTANKGGEG